MSRVEQRRAIALQEVNVVVNMVSLHLTETMGAAYVMAGAIAQDKGQHPGLLVFSMAPSLLQQFPLAAAIQAAPNGVVGYSYPLKGNEASIGHDLLVDPMRNVEAHLAVSTRKLTLAGPFQLVQGGLGVVARFPIYLNNTDGWPKFWGFSTVVMHVPRLLEVAGVMDLQRSGYRYSFCRVRAEGHCAVFASSGGALPVDPVTHLLPVPNSEWQLSVSPNEGWWRPLEVALAVLFTFVAAALLTALPVFCGLRVVRK